MDSRPGPEPVRIDRYPGGESKVVGWQRRRNPRCDHRLRSDRIDWALVGCILQGKYLEGYEPCRSLGIRDMPAENTLLGSSLTFLVTHFI